MEAIKPEVAAHFHKFGHVCFSFTNTLTWRGRPDPEELLVSYSKLVKWARIMQVVSDSDAQPLLTIATTHPDLADAALQYAIRQREIMYKVFLAVAHQQTVNPEDLNQFNVGLSNALAQARVVTTDEGFSWGWSETEDALNWIVWPVLRSAADLLASPDIQRVGVCESEECGYLFFDQSRNRSRRWCDMDDCGNRAKAKRFYDRQRDLCPMCEGTGRKVEITRVRCSHCRGRGVIPPEYMCKACHGVGSVTVQNETTCPDCRGVGVVTSD